MSSILSGISINSPNGQQIELGKLKKLENIAPFDISKLEPMSLEERQQQIDKQNGVHQTTVIERNGQVIASFGENGWRHFQNTSDFSQSFINQTDAQVIDALKQKYGSTLNVKTFADGQGPTYGDIFERINGYPPAPLVDYRV